MSILHVVVPEGIDDPTRPSGGNRYDRRVCAELASIGWEVVIQAVAGSWPHPDAGAQEQLAALVGRIPDGAVVLLDGLVASAADATVVSQAGRIHQVVLLHMPLGANGDEETRRREGAVLAGAAGVVVTSEWTRALVGRLYGLAPDRVCVARPGVDPAPVAEGTPAGGELLCVATVTRAKGQDVLVEALASIVHLGWSCTCVGSVDRDPPFARRMDAAMSGAGLSGRVRFPGACSDIELEQLFLSADLLVHPSRSETYGMVVTEALAHGLPVIASAAGGIPEALGSTMSGRPGVLVPPGDADALGRALGGWLQDPGLRRRLRAAAAERRATLHPWSETAAAIVRVCAR